MQATQAAPLEYVDVNGVPMLSATNLNSTGRVQAYFSTRIGGVSEGIPGALNLNIFKKIDQANAPANFDVFCGALGFDKSILVANRETHTNIVTFPDKHSVKANVFDPTQYIEADGMITKCRDICLFIYGSDCALFLLFDPKKDVIAAFHAGRAGSLNGIIGNVIRAMQERYGCNSDDILVAVSPSICQKCYCVDEPIRDEFLACDPLFSRFILQRGEKYHLDLHNINLRILTQAGIKKENIAISSYCTMCDKDLFHSYRRDKGANGVNGAIIRFV